MLAVCVKALADAVIIKRGVPIAKQPQPAQSQPTGDVETRAIAYLNAMPPAISGSSGHSQTFAAATALVHGFGIEPDRALAILTADYNPRCSPPWSDRELQHKVNQAATKPHDRPYGWLRDEQPIEPTGDPVDLSAFMSKPNAIVMPESTPDAARFDDPGRLPDNMFEVPGFVRQVMDFSLKNAPYPNVALAFCGAMALQSYLAGRKVATTGDLRTNIYLLALAGSGTGKEFPRKVNSQVLFQIGETQALGDKFASGEGIQDCLARSNKMLFQNDEMDGVLRQINLDRDGGRELYDDLQHGYELYQQTRQAQRTGALKTRGYSWDAAISPTMQLAPEDCPDGYCPIEPADNTWRPFDRDRDGDRDRLFDRKPSGRNALIWAGSGELATLALIFVAVLLLGFILIKRGL